MIVLQKESEFFKGIKDTISVDTLQIDMTNSRATGSVIKKTMRSDGYVSEETIVFLIANEVIGIKMIDPSWNEASTPPRPDGFILENPETWGTLMWEDIPFIDDPTRFYFKKLMEESKVNLFSGLDALECGVIKVLQLMKKIPESGWSIVDNGIKRGKK